MGPLSTLKLVVGREENSHVHDILNFAHSSLSQWDTGWIRRIAMSHAWFKLKELWFQCCYIHVCHLVEISIVWQVDFSGQCVWTYQCYRFRSLRQWHGAFLNVLMQNINHWILDFSKLGNYCFGLLPLCVQKKISSVAGTLLITNTDSILKNWVLQPCYWF